MCFIFQTRPFWISFKIPQSTLCSKYEEYFGHCERELTDRKDAIYELQKIIQTLQQKLLQMLETNATYDVLMKLYYIFDEVHSFYLHEKEMRLKLSEMNVSASGINDVCEENRNITRNIIEACNIWIENCVLCQKDHFALPDKQNTCFCMDIDLLIDLYIYGFVSQSLSLLSLSNNIELELFYGISITPGSGTPGEILKYHPVIYYNTIVVGNQNLLMDSPMLKDANKTHFGRGFANSYSVEFLLFLAVIKSIQTNVLRGDEKSLTVISKKDFIQLVESCTTPRIDGNSFYESFVLTKAKLKSQLRENETIIWVMGANRERHELRPFIGLEDGNVLVSYGSTEQAKQLWVSYFFNGGMCYSNVKDELSDAMNRQNQDLSKVLIIRAREILNSFYTPKIDEIEVQYYRIFGKREVDYGDFDIVFYAEKVNELFLIEAKFFSDSLNASGTVTDYKKLFSPGGYYEHCRNRYDLVLQEPKRVKDFIGAKQENVQVHLLFLTSKPIELELQDNDGVVTFLSLGIFDKYISGKLLAEMDDSVMRPTVTI